MGNRANSPRLSIDSIYVLAYLVEMILAVSVWFFSDPNQLSIMVASVVLTLAAALKVWTLGYDRPMLEKGDFAGPYRFLRFPHETASMLIAISICIASRSFPLTLAVIIIGGISIAIDGKSVDKSRSISDFSYLRYKTFVSSFIPSLIPFGKGQSGGFSWRKIFTAKRPGRLDFCLFAVIYLLWCVSNVNFNLFQYNEYALLLLTALLFSSRLYMMRHDIQLQWQQFTNHTVKG